MNVSAIRCTVHVTILPDRDELFHRKFISCTDNTYYTAGVYPGDIFTLCSVLFGAEPSSFGIIDSASQGRKEGRLKGRDDPSIVFRVGTRTGSAKISVGILKFKICIYNTIHMYNHTPKNPLHIPNTYTKLYSSPIFDQNKNII